MRKRFYILFVARDADGELRKIHIPLHYLYVFLAGAVLGMLTITGIAGSYTRMLLKVARFNELRTEKEQLRDRYSKLEQVTQEKDVQMASLGSLASQVSVLYGLKSQPMAEEGQFLDTKQTALAITQLETLRTTALSGAATAGLSMGFTRGATTADWLAAAKMPNLWPIEGRINSSFGMRIDPFNGESSSHRGIDIAANYGSKIVSPADGYVKFADYASGYGRMVVIDHGHGFSTRFGHLSGFAVAEGQTIKRGQVIGYVGLSGRSTGPHLHYEVWVRGVPVNPYRYLRTTIARARSHSGD